MNLSDRCQTPEYRRLLQRALVALAACLALVVLCYAGVDRPVAFYVHRHDFAAYRVFKWLTYPPPLAQTFSPLALALLMAGRARAPFCRWQKTLFVACLSLIVADEFRTSLGSLCGRYWPETWFGNPSLIGDGTYGFHPFEAGDDIGSFPSGHATRILSFATVWWISIPRGRMLWVFVCPPMLVSLVAMNYHFVGDVVAGSVLGAVVAVYAASLADLRPSLSAQHGVGARRL